MPNAANNGIRIRYEIDGSGPPLVLHMALPAGWRIDGRRIRRRSARILPPRPARSAGTGTERWPT